MLTLGNQYRRPIIGTLSYGHYSHFGGLSVNNYVRENNVRGIYVREYQSLVEISSISVRVFGTTVRGFMVDYRYYNL